MPIRLGHVVSAGLGVVALLVTTAARAALTLRESGGVAEAGYTAGSINLAKKSLGSTPFAQDVLGAGSFAIHQITHLNDFNFADATADSGPPGSVADDGYGNDESWIAGALNSFGGIRFATGQRISLIAWGRDNDNPSSFSDPPWAERTNGTYTVEYTTTPITINGSGILTSSNTWTLIGALSLTNSVSNADRHLYSFDPIAGVTGVRIIVSSPGTEVAPEIAIDEIEVFVPEPTAALVLLAALPLGLRRFRGK